MNQLVKDKVFTVKVVDRESYRAVVELVDASVTPVINVSSHLIGKGCAAEESRMALPAIGMSDIKRADGEYKHILLNWQPCHEKLWVGLCIRMGVYIYIYIYIYVCVCVWAYITTLKLLTFGRP